MNIFIEYIQEYVHEYIHRRIGKFVRFDELAFGKLTQRPCLGREGCWGQGSTAHQPAGIGQILALPGIFPGRTGGRSMDPNPCTLLTSLPPVKPTDLILSNTTSATCSQVWDGRDLQTILER